MLNTEYSRLEANGIDPEALRSAARAAVIFHDAEENLEHSVAIMVDKAKPFEADELDRLFFLVDSIRGIAAKGWFKATGDSNRIIHEFVRQMITGEINTPAFPDITLMDAVRFVKTVRDFKQLAYKPLFDVVEGKGDDGYGDFLDSLILAGQAVYTKVLCGAYREGDWDRLQEDITEAVGEPFNFFIIEGENYIVMFTKEKIQEFLHSWVRDNGGMTEETW